MIVGLLVGLFWFAVFFIGHVAVIRMARPEAKPKLNQRLFVGGAIGLAVTFTIFSRMADADGLGRGGWWMGVSWGELTYVGLFCLYMPFYYVVVASLSVRTVVMLASLPRHRLPLQALRAEFASYALVDQRLRTMAANGFLIKDGERYSLSVKGRFVSLVFAWLKRFWKLGAGG
jgi:hypothetical protein